jgi:hypothetical protein
MPNRILKESICYSEDINNLKPDEEIFFYRLIVNCDDYGRMDARPAILKSRLYPLKEHMKSSDINRYLVKLSEMKPEPLIILYENGGTQYLQMCKWEKHQQVRAKRSKYPGFQDTGSAMISSDINCNQMYAYVPENPNPNPNPESETKLSKDNSSPEGGLPPSDKCPHKEIMDLYNSTCKSLPRIIEMTEIRKRTLRAWWKGSSLTLEYLREYFTRVESSDFLTGKIKEFTADFDWIIGPKNRQKVIEGKYDNKNKSTGSNSKSNNPFLDRLRRNQNEQ